MSATDFGLDFVGQSTFVSRNRYEILFGDVGGFGDSGCDVSAFSRTDADAILAVTNDDEGAEAEATTALDDTRDAVDVEGSFVKLLFFGLHVRAAAASFTSLWLICHD